MIRIRENLSRFERFEMDWRRQLVQGTIIGLTGLLFALASLFNQNVSIMFGRELSWLPVSGMVILVLGAIECLDAYLAKEQRDFFQNLQVGVLDSVVGGMILLCVTESPVRLSLMIAAFLLVRGIVRITLSYALRFPHIISTAFGGLISIILGLLIWKEWPTTMGWFLAFGLNVEITFRGWAMIMFALWVRKQKAEAPAK